MMTTAQITVLDRRLRAVEKRQIACERKLADLLKAVQMIAERLNGHGTAADRDDVKLRRDRMMLLGGLALALAGIGLKAFAPAFGDWPTVALVLTGGALIPGNRVVELVTAWRARRNGKEAGNAG